MAVPLVVARSTSLAAKNGLLIKNRTSFENARKITTIVFDKTDTLTVGKFEVSKIVSLKKGLNENEIIRLASSLEQKSEHPIATGKKQKTYLSLFLQQKILMPSPARVLKQLYKAKRSWLLVLVI